MGLGRKVRDLLGRFVGTADRPAEEDLSPRDAARKLVDEVGASSAPAARETFEPEDRPAGPPAQPIAAEVGRSRSRASVAGVELVSLPEVQEPRPGDTIVPLEKTREELMADEDTSEEFYASADALAKALRSEAVRGLASPADHSHPLASEIKAAMERAGSMGDLTRYISRLYFHLGVTMPGEAAVRDALGGVVVEGGDVKMKEVDIPAFTEERARRLWPELLSPAELTISTGKSGDRLVMWVYRDFGTSGREKLFQLVRPEDVKVWIELDALSDSVLRTEDPGATHFDW